MSIKVMSNCNQWRVIVIMGALFVCGICMQADISTRQVERVKRRLSELVADAGARAQVLEQAVDLPNSNYQLIIIN